jgi:glycosyltransferase involved in cell wall biosynthesis
MSPAVIDPSYTPAEGASASALPLTPGEGPTLMKLALVIPTLREAENIRGLLGHVRSVLDAQKIPYEILVVDDDSRDGTEEIVNAISAEDPRVRLLVRKGQRGLSGAILHGWEHADAEIFGVMDADLQHPPELLPALFAAVAGGCDVCGGGVGDVADPAQGAAGARSDVWFLHGAAVVHGKDQLPVFGVQAAAGDSGPRADSLRQGDSVCLWRALPRREQSQRQGCDRLRATTGPAVCSSFWACWTRRARLVCLAAALVARRSSLIEILMALSDNKTYFLVHSLRTAIPVRFPGPAATVSYRRRHDIGELKRLY